MVESKKIAFSLKKLGKKAKQKIFIDLAKRIAKPRRTITRVNLWKLEKIAKKQKGKIFVVPGSVLGTGKISTKIKVAALKFSKSAKEKIENAEGEVLDIRGLAKEKASSMVIIK